MDLFDYMRTNTMKQESPLASRMRPETLDQVVGQKHIVGPGTLLYRAIKADQLGSIIFYGPPGTGKTTLAKVIAHTTKAEFCQINATVAGKKDMEEVVQKAKDTLGMYGRRTILFVDEIHRFNKSQQDYLLPFVEDGTLILIGATTENPYFEVNGALLSRSRIFELKALEKEDILELLHRAVTDVEKGMGSYRAVLDEDAADFLADVANGDARAALNALELGVLTTPRAEDGKIQMLYAGEDVKFIARRIMIHAAEDVGMADPQALNVAVSAAQAVERIGMPEARIILAEAVIYIASAPKSNSVISAIDQAMEAVRTEKTRPVPVHLKDTHYKGAEKLGHGAGYLYPHDFPGHYVKQQYLPDGMEGRTFYHPSDEGFEKEVKNIFSTRKK